MPTRATFHEHFIHHLGEDKLYGIRNDRTVGDVDLTERETYDLVKKLSKSPKEEKMSLASSIMETLGFEWI